MFQHTAARRRLLHGNKFEIIRYLCFNTQPPEGGCNCNITLSFKHRSFNTQPPEGGCIAEYWEKDGIIIVSTHSRPKAAAVSCWAFCPQ